MTEQMKPASGRCTYFLLYDGSKVKGEGDQTREGIYYFYPEKTSVDHQELLCGQLAGVGRCVSELSSSPVRVLRLRHSKFAIKMEEDLFWALGCCKDFPTVSMCDLLDQLIHLFRFYNGPVRQSYQVNSRETLALCWSKYLCFLQTGPTELHHIFSCLRTIDSTRIDPLLLLKAALILQACRRGPLVVAGCILFRGRVVSTQMPPGLTVRVMANETQTFNKSERPNGVGSRLPPLTAVTATDVHLTPSELQELRSPAVGPGSGTRPTPSRGSRLRRSRTPSDTDSNADPETGSPDAGPRRDAPLSPLLSRGVEQTEGPPEGPRGPSSPPEAPPLQNPGGPPGSSKEEEDEEDGTLENSHYFSFNSPGRNESRSDPDGGACWGPEGSGLETQRTAGQQVPVRQVPAGGRPGAEGPPRGDQDRAMVPMMLYQHRVNSLVLALLVEPPFQGDMKAMEEVYHSSLASLNGLEAHLRTAAPGPAGPLGPYVFAHYDSMLNTLTTNMSGPAGVDRDPSFVRATSLLHTHFCNSDTLQEAIIRSARAAIYAHRGPAQETYFLQHGGAFRNSGVPDHQDTAFSLPGKARHKLLKHGVSLL